MNFFQQLVSCKKKQDQEIYKDGAELSAKNRTLSILQKINEIILSAITRLNEISQFIATILVKEAGFENVSIFLFSKKDWTLQRIGFSETEKPIKIAYFQIISLADTQNLIIQAISKRSKLQAKNPSNI